MSKIIKAISCFIICIVMTLCLCACNKTEDGRAGNDYRMTVVYNDGFAVVYQDNETGVQYFSRANSGSCVMVNADGTPYTGE